MVRVSEASFQRNRELQRKRNAVNNANRGKRAHDGAKHERRPFIGWDGEGYTAYAVDSSGSISKQHRYMLFGCSAGYCETSIDLGTRTCLDLILYVEQQFPDAFHVGFAFEYDVNMILKDLEWRYLAILKDVGVVKWHGYRIKHIPHKMFSVSKNGVSATIYDVFGFFHTSYIRALYKHDIGTLSERNRIEIGKGNRSRFTYSDLTEVKRYWSVEISLLPPLLDKNRSACYDAGFFITQWHGPGALASFALRKYGIGRYRPGKNLPSGVKVASRYAYAGGRFEAWKCGYSIGDIWTADINSAYAFACTLLPRLDTGKWERVFNPQVRSSRDIRHFALYRISFDAREMERSARESSIPFPLFHRDKDGQLTWPAVTNGWYWSPEAATVAGNKYARFEEAWIFNDNGERPFAELVGGAYARRLQLQADSNPAEKAYKWFLASVYGQLAQRVGWNKHTRSAPPSHCLEWAGYITSYCRAYVFRAALGVARKGGLISIDTDGVTATVPFENLPGRIGTGLGEWKLEHFSGILFWQNGIYWLRDPMGEWTEPKTRGIPRKYLGIERAKSALVDFPISRGLGNPRIVLGRSRFIGYRIGLQHQFDDWRQWIDESVSVEFGGSGKGRHVAALCHNCTNARSKNRQADDSLHTIVHFPPKHTDSYPHSLPWLAAPLAPETNVEDQGIWEDI